ncbi:C69 family dipeptidase [Fructilactobacillus florum]|uniref:C69 family dipeptidase n=1 Tax=Fructilactobacillus florum TaxID=640331 RepID=UPI00028EC43F|nr:C69 family dipeptidase [Fructilactobacillus florum]EKK20953.1 Dipeptidase [Fructilactobacillus florum 2F]
METNYSACTSILIGRNATVDGSTIIGRNEDCKAAWPKRFIVHEQQRVANRKFCSKANGFQLALPTVSAKYTATPEWTSQDGLFEEDGINEAGCAMSATESTYANQQVLKFDPLVTDGIGEEAMVTVVLPYIKTAREGVERLGQIVSKYGACETNGILFSDRQEVWYFEIGSGHHWVAQRIPDDCYAVVANQMAIQTIDFSDHQNFAWSAQIVDFVNSHQLNQHKDNFNFRLIFGTQTSQDTSYNTPRVWDGQRQFNPEIIQEPTSQTLPFLRKSSRLLSVYDAQHFLSSHYQGTPYDPLGDGPTNQRHRFRPISLAKTQESHVLHLRPQLPAAVANIHWLLMGVGAQSTYVPFFAGLKDTPRAYQIPVTATYDSESAYWTFKLVGVLVDPHYQQFYPQLVAVQNQLQTQFQNLISETDLKAQAIKPEQLAQLATEASHTAAQQALTAYQSLAARLITTATDLSPLNYQQDLNL